MPGQLSGVFTDTFSMSLSQCKIPHCYKKSTIIPVPRISTPSCLNVYRPVALTSVVIKTLELLVLQFMKYIMDPLLDRSRFAYRENRPVDDVISLGLFYVLLHLDSLDQRLNIRGGDNTIYTKTSLLSQWLTPLRHIISHNTFFTCACI